MSKRPHPYLHDEAHLTKKARLNHLDRFSNLSNELILRIFSHVSVADRARSSRLSHRLQQLADDPQLWKSAYYSRFVRPRASRIPGLRSHDLATKALHYASKSSKWLDDDHLVSGSTKTDWKRQYKLRHNWSKGICSVSQTKVADQPSIPPLVVRLHKNVVFTASATEGLRAWSMGAEPTLLSTMRFVWEDESEQISPTPTSLAIDVPTSDIDPVGIAVGFADGRFGVYSFEKSQPALALQYMHAPSSNGTVSAIAYASPYLLTMTATQLLSLYKFPSGIQPQSTACNRLPDAQLLSSLKSHTAWPPLSLSIRATSTNISASIAYALPTYLAGWSVGLQELSIADDGRIIESRVASAQAQGFQPLSRSEEHSDSALESPQHNHSLLRQRTQHKIPTAASEPTSLSYTHPYLLAAHADNTLTLYLVISSSKELKIGPGRRLWGHTSSVASAHVGNRGKAVSVSKRGNDLRIWELEGGVVYSKKRLVSQTGNERSIQVRPEPRGKGSSGGQHKDTNRRFGYTDEDNDITKGWVAFDEEKVVVLREEQTGAQQLVLFDFT